MTNEHPFADPHVRATGDSAAVVAAEEVAADAAAEPESEPEAPAAEDEDMEAAPA